MASGDATDETAEVREQRRAVQAALAQLPADQREALELAYYGGLSQSELAERLGVPLGTVKSRMFAALATLRDLLGEQEALSVLPLFDNVPTRRLAVVTYALIAANLAVWVWELGARAGRIDHYAFYPCAVSGPCIGTAREPPPLAGGRALVDVPARELAARAREHAVPLHLREQRRGRDGPRSASSSSTSPPASRPRSRRPA